MSAQVERTPSGVPSRPAGKSGAIERLPTSFIIDITVPFCNYFTAECGRKPFYYNDLWHEWRQFPMRFSSLASDAVSDILEIENLLRRCLRNPFVNLRLQTQTHTL
jgi:hypothetical protein